MAFLVVRRATDEDRRRLRDAALRFLTRHQVPRFVEDDPILDVQGWVQVKGGDYPTLWRKCARRALRHPKADEIAYGYVGYSTKEG